MNNKQFADAIAEYTGMELAAIEVIPDPNVADAYAIKATMKRLPFPLYFIYTRNPGETMVHWRNLEEVEFTQWPPTSDGKLMNYKPAKREDSAIEKAIDQLVESPTHNLQASVNIDKIPWVQKLYDENGDSGEGEDKAMVRFTRAVEERVAEIGWNLNSEIDYQGERGGLFAVFSLAVPKNISAKAAAIELGFKGINVYEEEDLD